MASDSNIFTVLDNIRDRPTMFARSLSDLESQIWGYYAALRVHGIIEDVPSMNHHFLIWLHYRTDWSTCAGWASAIESHIATPKKQFAKLFSLIDEYRLLRPTSLAIATLRARHQPTGRRVVIGFDGRMEKPNKVEIICYKPEPLHFLRFHYKDKIVDDWLLMKPDGSNETTMKDAKQWAADELQVLPHEWSKLHS